MSTTTGGGEFGNPLRKFKLVFLGEQSGKCTRAPSADADVLYKSVKATAGES